MAVMVDKDRSFLKRFRTSYGSGIPFIPEDQIPAIAVTPASNTTDQHVPGRKTHIHLLVSTKNTPDDFGNVFKNIKVQNLKIGHVESRKSKQPNGNLELLVQFEAVENVDENMIIKQMQDSGFEVSLLEDPRKRRTVSLSDDVFDNTAKKDIFDTFPWFPKTINDLNASAKRVLMYGTDLDADHPGFKDKVYRERRMMFADLALNYQQETIYTELRKLHQQHACKEHLINFQSLENNGLYQPNHIPQLEDVSKFLRSRSGFQIRPIAGYLSSRDFLSCLAFRVFPCTQYIRHSSDPFYTPEPDCVHELLGHVPLFADPDFAQFSQEIGLASLGATDPDVFKLATLYFFTVEFGLCKQNGENKVYGAGLLSCVSELKHAIANVEGIRKFDPDLVIRQEMMITTFQQGYFYTESFEEAQQKIRMFTNNINRPFVVRYNPYTESIEMLNDKRALTLAVNSLRSDINLMASALHKII